jgi:hypothetical protein
MRGLRLHLLLAMTLRVTTDNFGEPRLAAFARMQMTIICAHSSEQLFDHEANTPDSARIQSGIRPERNAVRVGAGRPTRS